jgi:outer membrane protein
MQCVAKIANKNKMLQVMDLLARSLKTALPDMLYRSVIFVLAALGATRAGANDLLRLYELAVTHDATLQAATFQRDATIEAKPQAVAALLPQLGAQASADRERAGFAAGVIPSSVSANGTIASNVTANCVLSISSDFEHCYSYVRTYGLTLSQTLWSWQSFNQLREANSLAASAEATLLSAQQGLLLRVASGYFTILAAHDQLNTNRSARSAFGDLLKQAQVRQQTGVGPRSDVEQAQSFYDATEQSVIDAQNALDDAELALTEIVGTYDHDVAPLQDSIPLIAPDPTSVDAWVASAEQDNPSVRAAQLQVEASGRDINVQRGKGLPTVSLTGSTSHLYQDQALGGNETLDSVGVSFTWALFQGGAVASAVRQSRALNRQAQAQYEGTQRDVERQTRAAYRGVVTGIQRIAAAQRAAESGHGAVEASKRNLEFGPGTEFDLLNAQNNYYAAQRAYSQTRYDYLTNVLTLKQQAGRLSQADLAAIDALLVERGARHD